MDKWLNDNQEKTIIEVQSDEEDNEELINNLNIIIPISNTSDYGSQLTSRRSFNRSISFSIKPEDNMNFINNFTNINNLYLREELNTNKTISSKSKSRAYTQIIRKKERNIFQTSTPIGKSVDDDKQTYLKKKKKKDLEEEED